MNPLSPGLGVPKPSRGLKLVPSLSLEGRVALITGGSRGIGAATVRLFRAAGARVAFSYHTATAEAEALASELDVADAAYVETGEEVQSGPFCRAIGQELASPGDGRALVAAAVAAFGRLDVLVVNHGVWPAHDQPIETMPEAQWSRTLAVNLESVFGLVQAATAQMLTQPPALVPAPREAAAQAASVRGHMVLVASTAAQRGEAFHADYAASKGAIVSMTKSLSSELAPRGILVNCVAPGWVATGMSAAALSDPVASKRALDLIPLGRPATPDEIAGPILFLCTPMAGFISGEILNVNGGAVLTG